MTSKTAFIGLAALALMSGAYLVSQKDEAQPLADDASARAATVQVTGQGENSLPPAPENGIEIDVPGNCPNMANSMNLSFADSHTDATQAAIQAYEKTVHDGKFMEDGINRKIEFLDLNNDGEEDFVTLYTGINWCGSFGCAVEVFIHNEEGGYDGSRAFYSGEGNATVLEATQNGFRQMITPVRDGGLPSEQHLWSWSGSMYESEEHCLKNDG